MKESEAESQWGPEIFSLMGEMEDACCSSKQTKNGELALTGIGTLADYEDRGLPPVANDDDFDEIPLRLRKMPKDQDKKRDGRYEFGNVEEGETGAERWDAFLKTRTARRFPREEYHADFEQMRH